jgi:hypothetical protein
MADFVQVVNCIVAVVALFVLIRYTAETRRIRESAQAQVESMAKPCLTLWAKLRDPTDAILDMHDAVGAMVVRGSDAQFVVQNIGTGIALNVSYYFRALDTAQHPEKPGYLFYVLQGQPIQLPEPLNATPYAGNCEVVFRFQSIGGRWYQSTTTINNRVLTKFTFETVKA